MKRIPIALVLISVAFCLWLLLKAGDGQGRSKESSSFSKENRERISNGIPIVEKDWVIHKKDSFRIYYANQDWSVNRLSPYHLYKDISLANGHPSLETDAFHLQLNDSEGYRLILEFSWKNRACNYKFITYNFNDSTPVVSRDVDKHFYDSVLTKWKIELYPDNLQSMETASKLGQ